MTRYRHRNGEVVHLAYCTNVHPAESVEGVVDQLRRFALPLRRALSRERLGIGLWLAAPAAAQLRRRPAELDAFRSVLDQHGLEVVTFNGFPYRAFHAPVVKREVYVPDWTTGERAQFTIDLAWVLAQLLPDDVLEGSISTLPLGWRDGWTSAAETAARRQLTRVGEELAAVEGQTGRRIRLALEPEPGCVVEQTQQAIAALTRIASEWVGICLDACHLAVQFEEPREAVAALGAAGIPIVKCQASAALRASGGDRERLAGFVEPRFLHQVRTLVDEQVRGSDDLGDALAGELPADGEWRVHFHVPVHLDGGHTTQRELRAVLGSLLGGPAPLTRHIELETYTWNVLPAAARPASDEALVEGLARELAWLDGVLIELEMEAVA